MGGGPKRPNKDRVIMYPKSAIGKGGRPEYEKLMKCPESFQVNLKSSNLIKQLIGREASLLVVNEKEIRVMIGTQQVGLLSENQSQKISQCLLLGIKYQGLIHQQNTKRGLRIYAEFRRVA